MWNLYTVLMRQTVNDSQSIGEVFCEIPTGKVRLITSLNGFHGCRYALKGSNG